MNGKNMVSKDIFTDAHEAVCDACKEALKVSGDQLARVEMTPAKDLKHGHMTSNAAMVFARELKSKPRDLAEKLLPLLQKNKMFDTVEIAGPGFINFTIKNVILQESIRSALNEGVRNFGSSAVGKGVRMNVEYVSANPTGPLHVGHCRGAVVGDTLARLLERCGYEVVREYYINDAGTQVRALSWATYWRYLEALGHPISAEEFDKLTPNGLQYQGDYLIPVAKKLVELFGDSLCDGGKPLPENAWLEKVKRVALDEMMASIREDLKLLNIHQEKFVSEDQILKDGTVKKALDGLEKQGLLYKGTLEPPKGKLPDDWEPREQTLFRSTKFGDDVDRAIYKSDGTNTYFANDVGYHADKLSRSDHLIDIWGADHGGYVTRMKAVINALDKNKKIEILLCQIVRVMRNGEPVKMSKRAGTFVTLRSLVDEVGSGAVRFTMLTRKADAQMDFDLQKVVEKTRDNPVFYVQYAHARCCSVLRHAQEIFSAKELEPEALAKVDISALTAPEETELMFHFASFSRTLKSAAETRDPHRITLYATDLASKFHALWNRGRDNKALRFIDEKDKQGTYAHLALVKATATVLAAALDVLGVEPVEEMS